MKMTGKCFKILEVEGRVPAGRPKKIWDKVMGRALRITELDVTAHDYAVW